MSLTVNVWASLAWIFQVALLCFDVKKWVLRKAFFASLHVFPASAPEDWVTAHLAEALQNRSCMINWLNTAAFTAYFFQKDHDFPPHQVGVA